MTQIVGIVCNDAVVIGSESQYTNGTSFKQLEQGKIQGVGFKGGGHLIVALAGDIQSAKRTIDLMRVFAIENELLDEQSGVELARKAIAEFRKEVLDSYNLPHDLDAEKQDRIFDERGFELMIGFYHGRAPNTISPSLYVIDSVRCTPERKHEYAICGSGSQFASLMLSKFNLSKISNAEAIPLIIDALERAKESDPWCGGTAEIATLCPNHFGNKMALLGEEFICAITEKVRKLHRENIVWLHGKLQKVMLETLIKTAKKKFQSGS